MSRVESFGEALKRRRKDSGMRQVDLVAALEHVIARSTLANVEAGRERPSARLWATLQRCLPEWTEDLARCHPDPTICAQHTVELVPFDVLEATYSYTFREHSSPEEILLTRRIRATVDGVDGYDLQITSDRSAFGLEMEPLFGGWIEHSEHRLGDEASRFLTRFRFDRSLATGEEHEFALRSWVNGADPGCTAQSTFTTPTQQARITLNFWGSRQPSRVWHFGPLDDPPCIPGDGQGCDELEPMARGSYSLRLTRPQLHRIYGIGWSW
ncbi:MULTISPECIES: helix-turn-helix domain-containing protein [unclassified Luteococcus]|uniref:helix-turn-helix domain-containing protein n=1 Tax=unclassified Luteococcus TaxID=2639923 RepID=UPI00313E4000